MSTKKSTPNAEAVRRWRESHPDEAKASRKKWFKGHKDEQRARMKAYRQTPEGKVSFYRSQARYFLRKLGVPDDLIEKVLGKAHV
jgi:hypothetical protein